jgi:hypothetical protein
MVDPQSLANTVDDSLDDDPNEVESAWARVIERRRREIAEGGLEPIAGDEVLRWLRRWTPEP